MRRWGHAIARGTLCVAGAATALRRDGGGDPWYVRSIIAAATVVAGVGPELVWTVPPERKEALRSALITAANTSVLLLFLLSLLDKGGSNNNDLGGGAAAAAVPAAAASPPAAATAAPPGATSNGNNGTVIIKGPVTMRVGYDYYDRFMARHPVKLVVLAVALLATALIPVFAVDSAARATLTNGGTGGKSEGFGGGGCDGGSKGHKGEGVVDIALTATALLAVRHAPSTPLAVLVWLVFVMAIVSVPR